MEELKAHSHKQQMKMAELADEARNNEIRLGECKCPGTFANLLEAWLAKDNVRDYQGDWSNYNGVDVFSVQITGKFGTFRKNYFKTKFVRVTVNGVKKSLEIPEDPSFYKYAHRIMSDVEEHDQVIKQFTDGRMQNMHPPLRARHFLDKAKSAT